MTANRIRSCTQIFGDQIVMAQVRTFIPIPRILSSGKLKYAFNRPMYYEISLESLHFFSGLLLTPSLQNASCMVIKKFDAKYCKVFNNSMMMMMTVKTILEAARM